MTDTTPVLRMVTIYEHPHDQPLGYVVRAHNIHPGRSVPAELIAVRATLREAREVVPPGMDICIPRSPEDDPQIVESWM